MMTFKTELKPTPMQQQKLNQTFGNCRWVYNQYIAHNRAVYEKEKRFVSGYDFSKYLNNHPNRPLWLKETSSKATKQAIMNAEKAFKRFFDKQAKFPRFKQKGKAKDAAYFIGTLKVQRYRIQIPTLGWVRLKEYGYLPYHLTPKSVTVTRKAGRYYVSALYDFEEKHTDVAYGDGIGIDLGIKDFAILNDGKVFKNINKTNVIRKAEKRLKREQRKLARKYKNKQKGEATSKNFQKQQVKVQKAYQRLNNIRTDYGNKTVSTIVKQKPRFIALEHLNVKGMMKNKHLAKTVANQRFYTFKNKLVQKAKAYGIEVREVSPWFPSSKMCSCCGMKKIDLQLSDRTYHCANCLAIIDRDVNAAINLKNASEYVLLT